MKMTPHFRGGGVLAVLISAKILCVYAQKVPTPAYLRSAAETERFSSG